MTNRMITFEFGTEWIENHFLGAVAFGNMRAAFAQAVSTRPSELHEFFYVFAGRHVCLRILGSELAANIDRPFSHLRVEGPVLSSELTIELWDANKTQSSSTSVDPDRPWHETTVTSQDGRYVGQRLPHTFSCLDREAGHIVGSISWHERIFIYERAKPLARLLLNWHNDRNVPIIHTALVARNNNGVLVAGKSGSGKSTSSLACIIGGFDYLGEDYTGLERCGDGYIGHSLYNSVFVNTNHLERFTQLAPYAIRGRLPHEEKSVVILSQVLPQRLARAVPIRAMVMPRVNSEAGTRIDPASKGEALLALGPSSLLQVPNRTLGVRGFTRLAELVERIPCFRMELGSDLSSIPQCMDELFSKVSSG
jgi:hypothetical protein